MKKKQKVYETWVKGVTYEEKLKTGNYFKKTFKTEFANNTRSFISYLGKIFENGAYLPPASATRDKVKEKIKILNFIAVIQIFYKMNNTQMEEFLKYYNKRGTTYGIKQITDKNYLKSFCKQNFDYDLGEIPENHKTKKNEIHAKMKEYLEETLKNTKDLHVKNSITNYLKISIK